MRAATSSSRAASMRVPRSWRSACKSSIPPRRSGWCRRCRSSGSVIASRFAPRNDGGRQVFDLEGAMKRFNLSAWAVSHPALVLFLFVVLGVAGFFSYQKLGRAEDPFFTVKVVNVSAIWPGATANELQTQGADPIEKKLQELPFFEKVQTYSKPAFTAMQVTFRDNTPAKDVPFLFYLLRKKLVD